MQPLEFGKFIVLLLESFWSRCIFFKECKLGQAIIKRRMGRPIKWRRMPCFYFKWPLIDEFDVVDIRKKYLFLNAHSFHYDGMEKSIVPYNIIIDFQIEYQIINPLVIYDEHGFFEDENAVVSMVNNQVHKIISEVIIDNNTTDLDYLKVCEGVEKASEKLKKRELSYRKIRLFDKGYCKQKNGYYWKRYVKRDDCISINEIIITSFDKNVSIRSTQ